MSRIIQTLTAVSFVVLFSFSTGCTTRQEPPSVRRSRAIAAENIELKKQIQQRDRQIEEMRLQQERETTGLREELQKITEERDAWETRAKRNIREQVKGVLDAVVEDNARLRKENNDLKKQIEELKAENPG
jgi:TolA-binding protein